MHRVFFVASGRDSYSKSCANDDAGFDFIAFRSRFATVTMDVGNRIITISNEVGHVKSVQLLFLFLLHTFLHCCSPAVCFGGRCAAILGLFSVSSLRARFVSLIDSVLSTSHLSDHVRP